MNTPASSTTPIDYYRSRRIAELGERFRLSSGLPAKKSRKPRWDTLPGRMRALAEAGPGASVYCAATLSNGPYFVRALSKKAEEARPGMVVVAHMEEDCRIILHWPEGDPPPYRSRFGWETLAVGETRSYSDDQMPEKPNRTRGWRWLTTDVELWRRAKPEARKHAVIEIEDHQTHYSATRLT